jgi:hypothetical protein
VPSLCHLTFVRLIGMAEFPRGRNSLNSKDIYSVGFKFSYDLKYAAPSLISGQDSYIFHVLLLSASLARRRTNSPYLSVFLPFPALKFKLRLPRNLSSPFIIWAPVRTHTSTITLASFLSIPTSDGSNNKKVRSSAPT